MTVLALHMGLVSLIALGFAMHSRNTFLGNDWSSIAQLLGPETEDLVTKTRMATDGDVKRALSTAGHEDLMVGLRRLKSERTVGLRLV